MLLHLPRRPRAPERRSRRHGAMAADDRRRPLPEQLRRSLTWDQGTEMADHAAARRSPPACEIYFCDPHSPWQRGTNENTNGLLRQYFPKGTDLSGYGARATSTPSPPSSTADPARRLGWQTPAEALDELLCPTRQIHPVLRRPAESAASGASLETSSAPTPERFRGPRLAPRTPQPALRGCGGLSLRSRTYRTEWSRSLRSTRVARLRSAGRSAPGWAR